MVIELTQPPVSIMRGETLADDYAGAVMGASPEATDQYHVFGSYRAS
jgi:hypothetical protein